MFRTMLCIMHKHPPYVLGTPSYVNYAKKADPLSGMHESRISCRSTLTLLQPKFMGFRYMYVVQLQMHKSSNDLSLTINRSKLTTKIPISLKYCCSESLFQGLNRYGDYLRVASRSTEINMHTALIMSHLYAHNYNELVSAYMHFCRPFTMQQFQGSIYWNE